MVMKPIPIKAARAIARQYGLQGVAIFAFDGKHVAATSYGDDANKCKSMGTWIDSIVDDMEDGKIGQPFGGACPWPRITQD